ncbi:MAG: pantoate--beta-alanine ligase [Flavobacteriaceae bacterium]|nr:pantoate--beta-alanine ligase [Flavobacteriaceae bacterium]
MQVFKKKKLLSDWISLQKSQGKHIGFVPTMGALHSGHLSLVEASKKNNAITIVSIFVNPTQFNNQNDLKNYPKTLTADLDLLKNIDCDAVFIPSVEEMYTAHVISKKYDFEGIENEMEGSFRTGHFDGVATIVQALLETVKPDNAYFGEKDFQQLQIVKKLTKKQNITTNIIGCPIFREKDGLAMSSRNVRLTEKERKEAPFIYQTIKKATTMATTKSILEIKQFVTNTFKSNHLLSLEYFSIADEATLQEATTFEKNKKYRAFIAVNVGAVRLIDNLKILN